MIKDYRKHTRLPGIVRSWRKSIIRGDCEPMRARVDGRAENFDWDIETEKLPKCNGTRIFYYDLSLLFYGRVRIFVRKMGRVRIMDGPLQIMIQVSWKKWWKVNKAKAKIGKVAEQIGITPKPNFDDLPFHLQADFFRSARSRNRQNPKMINQKLFFLFRLFYSADENSTIDRPAPTEWESANQQRHYLCFA